MSAACCTLRCPHILSSTCGIIAWQLHRDEVYLEEIYRVQRQTQKAAHHLWWPLSPSSKACWPLPELAVGLTRLAGIWVIPKLRMRERERGRRDGETNKKAEQFGLVCALGIANQMSVAHPPLACKHTSLHWSVLTLLHVCLQQNGQWFTDLLVSLSSIYFYIISPLAFLNCYYYFRR